MSLSSGGAGLHQLVVSVVPKKHPGPQGPGLGRGGQDTVKREVIRAVVLTGCTLSIFMPGLHFRPIDQNVCGRNQEITMFTYLPRLRTTGPEPLLGLLSVMVVPKPVCLHVEYIGVERSLDRSGFTHSV